MRVLFVLVVFIALLVGWWFFPTENRRKTETADTLKALVSELEHYRDDCGRVPTTIEGLRALVERPRTCLAWRGPYRKSVPKDGWSKTLVYISDGRTYDLKSEDHDKTLEFTGGE